MKTSYKRLKRGDLFTVSLTDKAKSENKSTSLCGSILRVVTKAAPYIIVDIYDRHAKKWNPCTWEVNIEIHNLIRLKKEVIEEVS